VNIEYNKIENNYKSVIIYLFIFFIIMSLIWLNYVAHDGFII